MAIDQRNRAVDRGDMHQAEHRAKDLGARQLAFRADAFEDGWPDEVAALVTSDLRAAPIYQHLCALALTLGNQRFDALLAGGGDDRPHLNLRVKAVAHRAFGCYGGDALAEGIIGRSDGDRD
jgi:hypothetical protein